MKAVFFHCSIPLEIHELDESGIIEIRQITRSMQQGEVVDIELVSESAMIFNDGYIWWSPDKNLFNIVNAGQGNQNSCCGG